MAGQRPHGLRGVGGDTDVTDAWTKSVAAQATTMNQATMSVKMEPTMTSSREALYCLDT